MITQKHIELLKLIDKKGEITSSQGRRIYNTYKGFYSAVSILERRGYIIAVMTFGTWFYSLSNKGENFIRRLR